MPPAVPAGSPKSEPFVHHLDHPCCGHKAEPQQGLEDRVGKADAILYESPVYLWGWVCKRSCSGAARTHFEVLSLSPPVGRQVSSRVCLCIGLTERLKKLFIESNCSCIDASENNL